MADPTFWQGEWTHIGAFISHEAFTKHKDDYPNISYWPEKNELVYHPTTNTLMVLVENEESGVEPEDLASDLESFIEHFGQLEFTGTISYSSACDEGYYNGEYIANKSKLRHLQTRDVLIDVERVDELQVLANLLNESDTISIDKILKALKQLKIDTSIDIKPKTSKRKAKK